MKKLLRIFIAVSLLTSVSILTWLTATESGLRWAYQHIESSLPVELSITELEGRLIGTITAKGIVYQHNGTLIQADQLVLKWLPTALLTANISISRLQVQSLKIVLPQTEKTDSPLTLPDIHLPWRVSLRDVVIDGLSINQNDQTFALKQIKLNATTLFSQIDIEEFSVYADTFSLNIKGELHPSRNYRHELEIRWQAKLPSNAVIAGNGQLVGNMKMTRINQQLSGPLQLTLAAEVSDLLDQLNWQTRVDVTTFDASRLNANWPAVKGKLKLDGKGNLTTARLSGALEGDYPDLGSFDGEFILQRLGNNAIQIDQLMLHAPVSNTRLDARGQWLPGTDGGDITLALHWQNLRWPLKGHALFNSAIGSGWLEGNIHHYRLGLAADRPWPQAPTSTWYASAAGNLDGLEINSLRITALNGETTAAGQLNWSPQLNWHMQVSTARIDTASLWPQWPSQIDASLTSKGRFENGQLIADANISQLKGTLRGYPVSLHSRLSWRNNGLDIGRLDVQSGSSRVSAQGRVGKTLKLNWTISATDLAELYPQAEGQLQAAGQLSGPQDAPMIKASLNGTALSLPDYKIGSIDGTIMVDLFRWQQTDIRLAAQTLNLKGYTLQSLDINADTHHLTAKAVSDAATALIELKGKTNAKGWHGHIERADIQSQQYSAWQLKAPATFNINKKNLLVDTLCWHNKQEAKLCTSLQRENEAWQSHLEMSKFPLILFSPWLPPDLKLEGVVDATAELQFQAPDLLLGHALIELPPGTVSYPLLEGERNRWEYRGGKAEISLNHQGLDASAEMAMTNGDRFQGQLTLPGANLLALERQQPLQASAQLNIHELELIEALAPEVRDPRGEVELNISTAGTLAQPNINGRAHLLNGALRIPRLGLDIDQLSMTAQSDGIAKLNFRLDAHSGHGNLALQGHTTLDSRSGWPTEINIKGHEFEVARIPEAQLLVSPDLKVELKNHLINITGDVHIPYAKLQPKDITTAAHVSEDAVIIGGEHATKEKWSISTRINLTLGERVNFYGFGFEGQFAGKLLLEDEPGQLTRATGEISIPEGRYRAYGQRLDVEHGRLLYTGGPLANPGLDLRAVRHVANVTTGIKVRGNLNQPQLDLFSIPAMGQTDALAYLLLGRPIENTSGEEGAMMAKAALALGLSGGNRIARTLGDRFGVDDMRVESSDSGDQASLVMGRYLSPRLYISYGVGLIEAFNTLSVRYRISDQWQLKAESGEHQGADILYTIER